jgi:sporulation integral membrane protein YtvI
MQNEYLQKRKEFIINIAYTILVAALLYFGFKYAVRWLMPFIVGFVIALAVHTPVNAICKRIKINRKFCTFIMLVVEYALFFLLIWGLGAKIYASLKDLFTNLPTYYDNNIEPFIQWLYRSVTDMANNISPETLDRLYEILESSSDSIRDFITKFSASVVKGLASTTAKLPLILISFVFTILSSVFISMDYSRIISFVRKQLPARFSGFLSDAKDHLGKTIMKYLRAYIIIFILTFTELSIGLSILQIENAIGIAALIAIADIFPVLGTGGILIPWALISLLNANYTVAIGLIIVYLTIMVVRNFAEPKIVGDQLGLHPLVTLISIYLGYLWMGVGGMILLPITMTIIIGLHRSGKIKLWKE